MPPFSTLTVNVPGIRKIVYKSGGAYANSTFIDNLTFRRAYYIYLPFVIVWGWNRNGELHH